MIHNFNDDGFDSLAPKYTEGRPPKITLPERAAINEIALGRPGHHGEPCVPSLPDLAGLVPAFLGHAGPRDRSARIRRYRPQPRRSFMPPTTTGSTSSLPSRSYGIEQQASPISAFHCSQARIQRALRISPVRTTGPASMDV